MAHGLTSNGAGTSDHGSLSGLTDDDHSIYALLAGRSGGQTLIGGTGSGDDLTLNSTSHATKGSIFIDSYGTITKGTLTFVQEGTSTSNLLVLNHYDATLGALQGFLIQRALGTESSPSAVTANASLFRNQGRGWDGSAFQPGVDMRVIATGTWTGSSHPAQFTVFTVAAASTTQVAALICQSDQKVHVHPTGTADADLEVSDGGTLGNGSIHRASSGTHSSRNRKTGIRPIQPRQPGMTRQQQALADIKALQPVEFRYKRNKQTVELTPSPNGVGFDRTRVDVLDANGENILEENPDAALTEGYIFEDAPESIRGTRDDIIIDKRIFNLELALKEIIPALEARSIL